MSPIIERAFGGKFAAEGVAVWNTGDLNRILSLFVDDFEMRSPRIAERGC